MSFLGAIGHLMAGSGLKDILQLIFADNTVSHMLTGKALERALRGHFLVDTAINSLLVSKTFGVRLPFSYFASSALVGWRNVFGVGSECKLRQYLHFRTLQTPIINTVLKIYIHYISYIDQNIAIYKDLSLYYNQTLTQNLIGSIFNSSFKRPSRSSSFKS